MSAPPKQSLEAEAAVLGAILLSDNVLEPLLTEVRIRPRHFYRDKHRRVFAAMCSLYDAGTPIDTLTVSEAVATEVLDITDDAITADFVDGLCAGVPSITNAKAYAQRVVTLARWREDQRLANELLEAAQAEDPEKRDRAMSILLQPDAAAAAVSSTPDELKQLVWDHLESGEDEAWPWPEMPRLTELTLGGRRRGGVSLIGGWTSHGKSVWLDQILEADGDTGLSTWLYINEMSRHERVCRTISRRAGIPMERILRNRLNDDERATVVGALNKIPLGMTDAAGWSAEEIARDARGRGLDSIGVDILHNIDHKDEADLRRMMMVFKNLALQADAHVIVTVHLNTRRLDKLVQPAPTRGDIRGSGMLANLADNVMFVHRQQDERTGFPKPGAWIYFVKVRTGEVGGSRAYLDGARVKFTEMAGAEFEEGLPDGE